MQIKKEEALEWDRDILPVGTASLPKTVLF
jgi:hypothetical protein